MLSAIDFTQYANCDIQELRCYQMYATELIPMNEDLQDA